MILILILRMKRYISAYALSLILSIVFLAHQIIEPIAKNKIIDSYLDDVCFLPVAYGFIQFIIHNSIESTYKVNWKQAILGVLITSISTEILFPIFSDKHFADPFDVIAYIIGAVLFMILGNKRLEDIVE